MTTVGENDKRIAIQCMLTDTLQLEYYNETIFLLSIQNCISGKKSLHFVP